MTGTDTLLFSYDANGNVVAVNYNGTYYYYVRNGQNDVIRLIDGNNNTVVEYSYDSWDKQISCTGTLATTLGAQNPFRYRGYVYDPETGLYYLQTRYYDPEVGRFINADMYVSTGQGILGNNMYLYCGNNPVVRADDEGDFWNIVVGAVVGAIVGGVSAAINGDNVWAGIGIGAATGAISGATLGIGLAVATVGTTATTVVGMGIATGGGMAASAIGEYTRQKANGEAINGGAIWREAFLGGASNLLGFGIGKALGLAKPVLKSNSKIDILKTMIEGYKNQTPTDRFLSLHFSATLIGPAQLTASLFGGWVAEQ